MSIIICSGIHSHNLTIDFINGLKRSGIGSDNYAIVPIHYNPPLFPLALALWLKTNFADDDRAITIISFSAGVVGAIVAANLWQFWGGKIAKFIAVDGWGVPLMGDFPIYRLSHDYFTHWSSVIGGGGERDFYAQPAVSHLDLWRFPHESRGWEIAGAKKTYTNAAAFLSELLHAT
ncbi:MAG: hypothetical protein N5P05_000193 [Chroococcopsis gigantea SAG 12.99]|jgi:hypothetical protein|nr:hypothetical protein [Chlorogloea purpurea SAG 13.99]MDV2998587.1 hypothetical protein [Chroococcopsis gigantea SAG 12.99]